MKLLYLTHTETYFRMEIFLRKVAEYPDLGKCLFWIEVGFNLEVKAEYRIPLNNLLIIC